MKGATATMAEKKQEAKIVSALTNISTEIRFSEYDGYLFGKGINYESYKKLGAHPCAVDGKEGTYFAVWAPNAKSCEVLTTVSNYREGANPMTKAEGGVGIWECFVPNAKAGDVYRFLILGCDGIKRYKSDPYAFRAELRPANGSVITPLCGYEWGDADYMAAQTGDIRKKPMAIYEVHLGSWKKDYAQSEDGFMNYRQYAHDLAQYVNFMGYTHVELIGICEHPFDGSWGYQCTGFYAPTSRYGAPDDFRAFVDELHRAGIGVILDWVPAHFPKDAFCMAEFDGTHLYEYSDPLRIEMPGWGTYAFDHGKPEVKSFLISSAFYWVKEFHIDGIRVDAAAAMFLNNFDRAEYRPNKFGGVENIEGKAFLMEFNDALHSKTHAFTVAEDSSITAYVTEPVENGGVGFDFKWNLGWMNDTLKYFEKDPIYRKWHHSQLTHTFNYAYTENWVLVLSHDEVVHLKHSMLSKMPGTEGDQISDLKALYALQMTSPGKKLLFMGQDFGEDREWDEKREINWAFADNKYHRDILMCEKKLLSLYRKYPVLHEDGKDSRCFQWVNGADWDRNIISYIRRNPDNYDDALLVIANLGPVAREDYSCGVPVPGYYKREFSTYDTTPVEEGQMQEGDADIPPMTALQDYVDGYYYRLSYGLRPYEVVIISFPDPEESKKLMAQEEEARKEAAGKVREARAAARKAAEIAAKAAKEAEKAAKELARLEKQATRPGEKLKLDDEE